MVAHIHFEIENCTNCPFHERHQVITPDSFEYEVGIFCSKTYTPDQTNTRDGYISNKLVVADEDPDDWAVVPDWCPYVIGEYRDLISKILENEWSQDKRPKSGSCNSPLGNPYLDRSLARIERIISKAGYFLQQLEDDDLKAFLYGECFHSMKRDYYIMKLVALLRELNPSPKKSAAIAKERYLDCSNISEEDQAIIEDGILNWNKGEETLEEYDSLKKQYVARGRRPVLDTLNAIKLALYLAEVLDVTNLTPALDYTPTAQSDELEEIIKAIGPDCQAKFELVYNPNLSRKDIIGDNPKNAAELHFDTPGKFDTKVFKLWPKLITVPRFIAKEFLELRSFKVFVNQKEVSISRFVKKTD